MQLLDEYVFGGLGLINIGLYECQSYPLAEQLSNIVLEPGLRCIHSSTRLIAVFIQFMTLGSIIEPASATTDIAQIVSPSSIPVTVHQLPSAGHGLKPPQNLQKIITDNNVALPKDFATTASVDLSAEGTQSNSASDAMDGPDRDVVYVAFGPRGGWYVRWSDGSSAWEQIPPSLHTKLYGRMRNLPHAECISISEMSQWVTVFGDGSFATSGFPVYGKLKEALHDPPQDAELKTLIFAPGGGWLLMRDDGSMAWERLPSGLDELLKRRTKADAPVDCVSISGFGGWFLRFTDG